MRYVQIVLKLPDQVVRGLDSAANANGFTRPGYVAHLIATYRRSAEMDRVQRYLLQYLWSYGPLNRHAEPPRMQDVAHQMHCTPESMRAAAEELLVEGLLGRAPIEPAAGFRNDVAVSNNERLFLTRAGRTVAATLG